MFVAENATIVDIIPVVIKSSVKEMGNGMIGTILARILLKVKENKLQFRYVQN